MTTRPTGYATWCATGATNLAQPDGVHQNLGWAVGEAPPSSYFNFLQQQYDQWIRYLDSVAHITSYETIILDDFARGAVGPVATGTLGPIWSVATLGDFRIGSSGTIAGALGVLQCQPGPQGAGAFDGPVAIVDDSGFLLPFPSDFRFDFVGSVPTRGASGCSIEVGLIGVVSLAATGPSGLWNLLTKYATGTSALSLGVGPAPSGFNRLTVECVGTAISAQLNGATLVIGMAPPALFGSFVSKFGVQYHNTASGNMNVAIDRLELKARRLI